MSKKTKKLFVIGHQWPQPNATAAGEHMMHIISYFLELNYEILFVCASQIPKEYTLLDQLFIKYKKIYLNNNSFDALIKEFSPSVVLFDRFMTEEQFGWRVQLQCPDAVRILDTEDLHFLRNSRLKQLKNKTFKNRLSDITKRELASIYRCDCSLIISKVEKKILTKTYKIPKYLLFHLPLLSKSYSSLKETPTYLNRNNLIFVGNFLHEPNWNCVQYLKKEIWPKLSKKLPKAILHIYGSHAVEKHLQLSNAKERFIVHGYTEDLKSKLLTSKLLIAPIQFGAGQKGKLLKAMEHGLPSVTTSIGAEGMLFNNKWAGSIANTPEDFITQTTQLYLNEDHWLTAQNKAYTIIKERHNYDSYFKKFQQKLNKLDSNLNKYRGNNFIGQILWHHSLRSTEFMSRWIMEKNKQK